jgi:hypothetical protein
LTNGYSDDVVSGTRFRASRFSMTDDVSSLKSEKQAVNDVGDLLHNLSNMASDDVSCDSKRKPIALSPEGFAMRWLCRYSEFCVSGNSCCS